MGKRRGRWKRLGGRSRMKIKVGRLCRGKCDEKCKRNRKERTVPLILNSLGLKNRRRGFSRASSNKLHL